MHVGYQYTPMNHGMDGVPLCYTHMHRMACSCPASWDEFQRLLLPEQYELDMTPTAIQTCLDRRAEDAK